MQKDLKQKHLKYLKEKKIPISQEIINLLVARSRGDRLNLNNEITKIENFTRNKKRLDMNETSNNTAGNETATNETTDDGNLTAILDTVEESGLLDT